MQTIFVISLQGSQVFLDMQRKDKRRTFYEKEGHFRSWHGRRMLKSNIILGLYMVGILYYTKTKHILNDFNHHGNTLQKLMANMA